MKALVAYIRWLSRDQVEREPFKGRGLVQLPALKGDPVRGQVIYADHCAVCHRVNGEGLPPTRPALWGHDTYNDGASMNDPAKMAAFVAHTMPKNQPGTLTAQQTYDVAAYIHTMPRPKFAQAYKQY